MGRPSTGGAVMPATRRLPGFGAAALARALPAAPDPVEELREGFAFLRLERVEPEKNAARFYELYWAPTLLGWAVVRTYGRIGRSQRTVVWSKPGPSSGRWLSAGSATATGSPRRRVCRKYRQELCPVPKKAMVLQFVEGSEGGGSPCTNGSERHTPLLTPPGSPARRSSAPTLLSHCLPGLDAHMSSIGAHWYGMEHAVDSLSRPPSPAR